MSVRAKILQLLTELKRDLGLTYIYITHDLASARFFCDRVAIMYLGKVVEIGPVEEIFDAPRHPYTKALLRAVPDPDPSRGVARDLPRGEVPDAARPPMGCSFHPRCPEAFEPCGWETRDVRMVLEQRWTTVDAEQYQRESALAGPAEHFDIAEESTGVALLKPGRAAEDELELLQQMRAADPDEPLWSGVEDLRADGGRVRIGYTTRYEPHLQRVEGSNVDVSCHRYHDPTKDPRNETTQVSKQAPEHPRATKPDRCSWRGPLGRTRPGRQRPGAVNSAPRPTAGAPRRAARPRRRSTAPRAGAPRDRGRRRCVPLLGRLPPAGRATATGPRGRRGTRSPRDP
jgi:oligopeptide/dipeptide ABC transporter ATP-binding protein